uniref:Sperm-lysin n=1 Tax=Panagrolaimus davidi TaxID=227884 RepID=A0A914QUR0_9BILA
MKLILIILASFPALIFYGHARLIDERTEKFDRLRLTPKSADTMKNLHKNTYYTAVKAIIGKMGSILYKELPKTEKKLLARCLDKIEDRRELINSAKCVVIARKRFLKIKSEMTKNYLKFTTPSPISKNGNGWKAFLQQFDDFDRLHSFSSNNPQTSSNFTFIPKKQRNGFFKEKEIYKPFSKQSVKIKDTGAFKTLDLNEAGKAINEPSTKFSKIRQRILEKKYKKFHVLGKKLNVNVDAEEIKPAKLKIKKLDGDQQYGSLKIRRKRSLRFPDSKDHYYKEAKYKVSKTKFFQF